MAHLYESSHPGEVCKQWSSSLGRHATFSIEFAVDVVLEVEVADVSVSVPFDEYDVEVESESKSIKKKESKRLNNVYSSVMKVVSSFMLLLY